MPCSACGGKAKPHSGVQAVINAARAAGKVAIGVVSGKEVFSEEELIQKRMKKCAHCEYIQRAKGKCGICHCYLDLKVKVLDEHCPVGKW